MLPHAYMEHYLIPLLSKLKMNDPFYLCRLEVTCIAKYFGINLAYRRCDELINKY